MTDSIKVSDIEAFAMAVLAQSEDEDELQRETSLGAGFGAVLLLQAHGHNEAASRVMAEILRLRKGAELEYLRRISIAG